MDNILDKMMAKYPCNECKKSMKRMRRNCSGKIFEKGEESDKSLCKLKNCKI
jgi:hypothetical protein